MHSVPCRIQYRNWQRARIEPRATTPEPPTATPVATPAAIPVATVHPANTTRQDVEEPIFFSEQDDSYDRSAYPTVPTQYFVGQHASLIAETAAQFGVPHLEDFLGQEW